MKHNTLKLLDNAVLETLEDRRMWSGTPLAVPTLSNGIVSVQGSASAASRATVDYGTDKTQLVVDNNGTYATFPIADVKQLNITMGSGKDYVYINPAIDIPANVRAGDGVDTIRTGAGNDTIVTGNGNDLIYGKRGDNDVTVGDGNDTVIGQYGNDSMMAGNGNDLLVETGQAGHLTAGNGNDTFVVGSGHSTIIAGTGHDVMVGGSNNVYLSSNSSNSARSTAVGTGAPLTSGSSSAGTGITSTGTTTGTGTSTTGTSASDTTGAGTTTTAPTTGTTSTGTTSSGSTTSGTTTTGTSGAGGTTSTGTTSTGTTSTGTTSSGTTSTGTTSSGSTSASGSTSTGTTSTGTGATGTTGAGTGTTGTSTTGTSTTGTSTTGTGASDTTSTAPVAMINTLAGPRFTGLVANFDGLTSTLGAGTALTANFQWNYGDTAGTDNDTTGFNGSHVYDAPGTYTVSLTVTNVNGMVSTSTTQITIAASQRKQIYVDSVAGSDTNAGTATAPLQSLAAAFGKMASNVEILLHADQSFDALGSLHINSSNVLIGRYGTGTNPTIMRQGGAGNSTIASYGNTNGLTIQDINFDSPFVAVAGTTPNKVGVSGIYAGGSNIAIRDCAFLNIDDAINENGSPVGVLIQNNTTPLDIGVRGYFIWGQGAEQLIIGNTVTNSDREHNMRLVDLTEVSIENNTLANHDGKGCIEIHRGSYEWVKNNSVTDGDIRVGPLGLWGEDPSDSTDWSVIQDNQLTDTMIYVQAGAHHSLIDNNVITETYGAAIQLNGMDSAGRESMDITISNNTVVDSGTAGNFVHVLGQVNGIVMTNNLFVAPNLQLGSNGATPVRVDWTDLSDFTQISNNIWPSPKTIGTYANGGINLVGTGYNTVNFLTIAQWNAESNVDNDVFDTVTLNGSYRITANDVTAGSTMAQAA